MKKQIPIDQQKGMFTRCKKCKGYGYRLAELWYHTQPGFRGKAKAICSICKGSGRLDWVERIIRQ